MSDDSLLIADDNITVITLGCELILAVHLGFLPADFLKEPVSWLSMPLLEERALNGREAIVTQFSLMDRFLK